MFVICTFPNNIRASDAFLCKTVGYILQNKSTSGRNRENTASKKCFILEEMTYGKQSPVQASASHSKHGKERFLISHDN